MGVTVSRRWRIAGLGVALLTIWALATVSTGRERTSNPPNTGMADPVAFLNAFDRFVAGLPAGAERLLVIPLTGLRGVATESLSAGGSLSIDFADGSVRSQVTGLPPDGAFDLWLVDNKPSRDHSTLAEALDVSIKVGKYQPAQGAQALTVTLGRERFADFMPDRGFVVRANQSPLHSTRRTGRSFIQLRQWKSGKSRDFATLFPRQMRMGRAGSSICARRNTCFLSAAMPGVLEIGPYKFVFFSVDRAEPIHIHVKRDRQVAKFWLRPVSLAKNKGFRRHELDRIARLVVEYEQILVEAWNDYFDAGE